MRRVYVAGIGMTKFGKQPGATLKSLSAAAIAAAIDDAELSLPDLDEVYFANAVGGSITGQEMVAGQVALRAIGVDRIPIFNVENACASASTALHLAWRSISSGTNDVVLAVGAEIMSHPNKRVSFQAIAGAMDQDEKPPEENWNRSPFMDTYAIEAREYMEASGATQRDFASVAAKNHRNGGKNPLAQYGGNIDVDQVLNSREIVWPLTKLMCSPISDGAAAVILTCRDRLHSNRSPVRVVASVLRSGVAPNRAHESATTIAASAAYAMASIGPEDVDLAEVHDAAASAELLIYEQLGFAQWGAGPALLRDGATEIGGRLPINTSGGLLARGHPIGATGLAQVVELVEQLEGRASERQVGNPQIALAHNAGGFKQGDNMACAVHILRREDRSRTVG